MSATFAGFSEDDIRKVQGVVTSNSNNKLATEKDMVLKKFLPNQKKSILKTIPKPSNDIRIKKVISSKSVTIQEIPEEAKLNKPLDSNELKKPEETEPQHIKPCEIIVEKKLIDLKQFEIKQKEIEEQNRRRKELLSQALAARTKQTQAEAQRLQEIQSEFKKLDAVLSSDVRILRHQIELASVDYMEAQKKYLKSEKEYLEAKVLLHQRLEKKEMLTEHLCTIIEKNEERKAEKLMELLNKLQLQDASSVDSSLGSNGCSNSENHEISEEKHI